MHINKHQSRDEKHPYKITRHEGVVTIGLMATLETLICHGLGLFREATKGSVPVLDTRNLNSGRPKIPG